MPMHEQTPHFVLLPMLAQGHMIPMVDIAKLLAKRDVPVTILTTPHNANRFKTVFSRANDSGLNIRVVNLKFPSVEVGLPQGCENFDMLPCFDDAYKFFTAISMLQEQVEDVLQEIKPSPSCLIADMCFIWASDVSLKLHVPRIVFHGTSCFSLLCLQLMETCKEYEALSTSDTEYFVVPDMPGRIEITKAQLRGVINHADLEWTKIREQVREAEDKSFGILANTIEELEPEYVEEYCKVKGKKVWCVGPVSLCNTDDIDKAERGNKASIEENQCLKWLESHKPSSVIYVCLGSLSAIATSQLIELGLGLEASNRPFIWVIRDASHAFRKWLVEENFEDRVKDRGFLIIGWAPQVLILSHLSIGGFLTHCGWNSTLEGITAGLPMITWPIYWEQFCNEKFIVNVIKTGIRVGVEVPVVTGEEENIGVLVNADDVKMAIDKLMDAGEECDERKERARKLKQMAERAVEEGGSSYSNLTTFIQDVMELANARTRKVQGVES